jgi:hypothetical protein
MHLDAHASFPSRSSLSAAMLYELSFEFRTF